MRGKIGSRLLATLKPQDKPFEVFNSETKGFILRQEPKPSGRRAYYVAFTLPDGTRGRLKLGDAATVSPAAARDKAKQALASAALGKDPRTRRRSDKPETIGAFAEGDYKIRWLDSRRSGA